MITKILLVVLLIAGVLAVGLWLESRREKSLRAWVARKPGAQLYWPFVPVEHSGFPAEEWTVRLRGHPPLGWGSAVREMREGGEVWCAEFRAAPAVGKASRWYLLVARRRPDGSWFCDQREGLLSEAVLGEVFETPVSPSAHPPSS